MLAGILAAATAAALTAALTVSAAPVASAADQAPAQATVFERGYDTAKVVTLTFDKPGSYSGQCAEFCGLRHADMVFTFHAVSRGAFDAWARSRGTNGA